MEIGPSIAPTGFMRMTAMLSVTFTNAGPTRPLRARRRRRNQRRRSLRLARGVDDARVARSAVRRAVARGVARRRVGDPCVARVLRAGVARAPRPFALLGVRRRRGRGGRARRRRRGRRGRRNQVNGDRELVFAVVEIEGGAGQERPGRERVVHRARITVHTPSAIAARRAFQNRSGPVFAAPGAGSVACGAVGAVRAAPLSPASPASPAARRASRQTRITPRSPTPGVTPLRAAARFRGGRTRHAPRSLPRRNGSITGSRRFPRPARKLRRRAGSHADIRAGHLRSQTHALLSFALRTDRAGRAPGRDRLRNERRAPSPSPRPANASAASPATAAPASQGGAIVDGGPTDGGDAGPEWTGPYLYALFAATPIMSDMDWPVRGDQLRPGERQRSIRIGYFRQGQRLPAFPEAHVKPNCPEGWYELVSGGFVCAKFATLNPNHPKVRNAPHPPESSGPLPYAYGINLRNGVPMYKRLPSHAERVRYEPWLTRKPPRPRDDGASERSSGRSTRGRFDGARSSPRPPRPRPAIRASPPTSTRASPGTCASTTAASPRSRSTSSARSIRSARSRSGHQGLLRLARQGLLQLRRALVEDNRRLLRAVRALVRAADADVVPRRVAQSRSRRDVRRHDRQRRSACAPRREDEEASARVRRLQDAHLRDVEGTASA